MELTLACEFELMISTFLRKCADSVSASASTSVDLPTPPLVFMTAIELRMARTGPSISVLGSAWDVAPNVADS